MGYLPQCGPPGSQGDQISCGEARFYQGELIRCQSDNNDYVCPRGEVAMSDSDGTNSNTRVLVVRCVWAPVVTFYHVYH
jgi:hypothetical protein